MSTNLSSSTVTVNIGALSNTLPVTIQQATDGCGAIVNAGTGSVSTLQPSSSVFSPWAIFHEQQFTSNQPSVRMEELVVKGVRCMTVAIKHALINA